MNYANNFLIGVLILLRFIVFLFLSFMSFFPATYGKSLTLSSPQSSNKNLLLKKTVKKKKPSLATMNVQKKRPKMLSKNGREKQLLLGNNNGSRLSQLRKTQSIVRLKSTSV